jgi:hypothetical protein
MFKANIFKAVEQRVEAIATMLAFLAESVNALRREFGGLSLKPGRTGDGGRNTRHSETDLSVRFPKRAPGPSVVASARTIFLA